VTRRTLTAILVLALAALTLLSLRQQRIAIIHDMSVLHRRHEADRAARWRVRADVARWIRPERVQPDDETAWAAAVRTVHTEPIAAGTADADR